MKAGVFDSGVGGLTVLKSLIKEKIFEEIVYYGDTARVPYGSKDKNTIISYSLEALEFLKNFPLDIIIVACNSVSAYALEELRQNTNIPLVGVIESGALALEKSITFKESNILVIGTKATIDSKLYEISLKNKNYQNITSLATPLLVPLVEEGIFDGTIVDEILKYYFKDLHNIDCVILGCTHFPLLEKKISSYFNNCKTIHSGDAIIEILKKDYNLKNKYKDTKISYFASSNPDGLKAVATSWLNI